MTSPLQFIYTCPNCGFQIISNTPDLEVCTVPVYKDGEPVFLPRQELDSYDKCGGDFTEWGPSVWWWQIPEDLQAEILKRESEKL